MEDVLAVKTHDDSTEGLTTMFNVKVDLHPRFSFCQYMLSYSSDIAPPSEREMGWEHTLLVMTGPLAASAPGERTKQMATKRATRRERNDLEAMVVGIG